MNLTKKHEAEIIQKLAPLLIVAAPAEEDLNRNTDLWLSFRSRRIAYRIREYNQRSYFKKDFTIRFSTTFGNQSEYDKILNGHGHWFFYGLATSDGTRLHKWVLYDLVRLSAYWNDQRQMNGHNWVPGVIKYNSDGSDFLTIPHDEKFIITRGEKCVQ